MHVQIRLTALVPLLLSLAAFILSMLCIFAGSKTDYLEGADLLTVRTRIQSNLITTEPNIMCSLIPLCLVSRR